MADKEQVKPLTAASPDNNELPFNDQEVGVGRRSPQYLNRRRCIIWCCGCCTATVVVLGVVILVLALTVFKVKDPVITLNAIHVDGVDAGFGSLDRPVSVNATFTADISVKNPNAASFKFDNSTTEFYYEGDTVAAAYSPEGSVSAHRTVRLNVTVDVLGDRVANHQNLTQSFLSGGDVNVTSYTDLNGRVNVLGIYKRDMEVTMNCSLTLSLSVSATQDAIKNKVCEATVK